MKYRKFGKTGWNVSEIGFGAWAIGGSWGSVDKRDAVEALQTAIETGVNFIDTADVYGDGRSEQIVSEVVGSSSQQIYIATKAGRRLSPHEADGYNEKNLRSFVERSLKNLNRERIDLLQLHCPPTEVYYRPEVFEALDRMVEEGVLSHYGVSVEKVEEGIKALNYPGLASVQIIFNMFRQRPADLFFRLAKEADVAVITRVPLASGLLTGKMSKESSFPKDDHRHFNREGQAFDKGETFAGVPFDLGLEAVDRLKELKPESMTMAQFALRWILQFEAVSVAIPGAKNREQALLNAETSGMATLDLETLDGVREIYRELVGPAVHERW
jgi:aryl-alcohol dehydrogenase-like predicted oxidoreductase